MVRFENYINDISTLPEMLRFQEIGLAIMFCFIHVVVLDKFTIKLKQIKQYEYCNVNDLKIIISLAYYIEEYHL